MKVVGNNWNHPENSHNPKVSWLDMYSWQIEYKCRKPCLLFIIYIYFFYAIQIGSVDEESTKSDEEYDDLAMQDVQDNGYWSDDEEAEDKLVPVSSEESMGMQADKYRQNLELFLRTKSEPLSEPCSYSLLMGKNERRMPSGNVKMRKRSLSIPAFRKHGSFMNGPILSGAPHG